MPRLRLIDFRASRGPKVLGVCNNDYPSLAEYVNSAQQRLIFAREAGDEGWYGTWAEVAFNNVSRTNPYITCPRNIARLEKVAICNRSVPVRNQFYEYLNFGNGRLPRLCSSEFYDCSPSALMRNNVITFTDQSVFPCKLRVYALDPADINGSRRVLFQGLDQNDQVVYCQDGNQKAMGEFVTLDTPFVDASFQYNRITGIQKDWTQGPIQIFQVNPTTGDETLLLTMEGGETTAGYRRYYLSNLPLNCCNVAQTGSAQNLVVTAIAKMEMVPVVYDTDYLLIQNLEAVIEECISKRMSEMDNMAAQQLATVHHINAIRLLNSEITHYLGKQSPAVSFAPFGTARLERRKIGALI